MFEPTHWQNQRLERHPPEDGGALLGPAALPAFPRGSSQLPTTSQGAEGQGFPTSNFLKPLAPFSPCDADWLRLRRHQTKGSAGVSPGLEKLQKGLGAAQVQAHSPSLPPPPRVSVQLGSLQLSYILLS